MTEEELKVKFDHIQGIFNRCINHAYQIITDSLGHVNKDSDKYYYSLDSEKLRSCCLDARWIGIKSWM